MNPDIRTGYDQSPETFVLPPEYEFMSVENIEHLRSQQLDAELVAKQSSLRSDNVLESRRAAEANLLDQTDTDAERYVAAHMKREDNPELYDRFQTLVAESSYYRAKGVAWHLGKTDEHGNHTKLETSGQSRYEEGLKGIFAKDDEPAENDPSEAQTTEMPVIPPSPEAITLAQNALRSARHRLADLSVQRRRLVRKGSKKAQKLEEQFNKAQKDYETSRTEFGALRARVWQESGQDQTALRANVIRLVLDEHQQFTRAEAEHLAEDPSRRAKLARFLAGHKLAFAAGSAATGFGMGYGLNKAAKGVISGGLAIAGVAALPATIAGGVAVKTTKAVLQSSLGGRVRQHHTHDHRSKEDLDDLKEKAKSFNNDRHTPQEMMIAVNGLLSERIGDRVHKDIRSNRNRVIAAAAISGAMGAVGYLAASELGGKSASSHRGAGGKNVHHKPGSSNATDHHKSSHHHKHGVVDGYNTKVTIRQGEGYSQAITDMANQKDIHLSGSQSWQLYEHLNDKFHGNFLTDDPSYHMNNGGEWGISHAGTAHWDPAVVHEMNRWMHENGHKKLTAAAKAAKAARRA